MVTYTIDRFEEELAVLEDENGVTLTVARALLPAEAAESDVVRFENGVYTLDRPETDARREQVLSLQKRLKRK